MTLTPPGQPDPSATPSGVPRPAPPGVFVPTGAPPAGPGPVPLRPLTVSDLFDAGFRVVRRNAGATVGAGLLVGLGSAVVPVGLSVLVGTTTTPGIFSGGGLVPTADPTGLPRFTDGDVATLALLVGNSLLLQVAAMLVYGVVAPVTSRAALGENPTLSGAWQRVRPSLGRLLVLALVVLLVGAAPLALAVGAGAAAFAGGLPLGGALAIGAVVSLLLTLGWVYVTVRHLVLAPAVLTVERLGVGASLARAGRLAGPPSAGAFWRVLGLYLLMWIVVSLVVGVASTPLSLLGTIAQLAIGGSTGTVVYLVITQLAGVLGLALRAPFLGVVRTLLYLDQRFRREGLDVELIQYVHERDARD